MDADERARLRALRETIPAGDVTPCCERAGQDGHHSSWALGMMPHGAALRAWVAGPLDLLALARTALPVLLDDADAADARIAKAERERDEARAEVERLRAEHEAPGLLWYAYDAECGYETYRTATEAKAAAEASIESARDEDHWPEEVEYIEWGRLIPYERATQTEYVAAKDDESGRCERDGLSHLCNYELADARARGAGGGV